MMYEDGWVLILSDTDQIHTKNVSRLFLGMHDSAVDASLKGTHEEPQLLLRFNTLVGHLSTQQASIRYIIHHG